MTGDVSPLLTLMARAGLSSTPEAAFNGTTLTESHSDLRREVMLDGGQKAHSQEKRGNETGKGSNPGQRYLKTMAAVGTCFLETKESH